MKANSDGGDRRIWALAAAYDYVTVLLATGLFILSKTVLRPVPLSLISKRSSSGLGRVKGGRQHRGEPWARHRPHLGRVCL